MEEIKYTNRAEWLGIKKTGISGTEISAIMGMNKWKSPLAVYLDKKSEELPPENNDIHSPDFNMAMWNGAKDEPKVAELFRMSTGLTDVEPKAIYKEGHYLATPDRFIKEEPDAVLELKTSCLDDWFSDAYKLQVNWYCGLLKKRYGYICCQINNRKFDIEKQLFDEALFEKQKIYADIFWNDFVLKNRPPAATLLDKTALPKLYGTNTDIKDLGDWTEKLSQYKANEIFLKEVKSEYEEKIKEIEKENQTIMVELQDYLQGGIGESDFFKVKNSFINTPKINVKKLMAEMPEVYEKYKQAPTQYYRTTINYKEI